jgi:hypothetical protein
MIILAYLGCQCTKFHITGWTCWFLQLLYVAVTITIHCNYHHEQITLICDKIFWMINSEQEGDCLRTFLCLEVLNQVFYNTDFLSRIWRWFKLNHFKHHQKCYVASNRIIICTGVPGGMCQTSGGCSLCWSIPI